MRRWRRSLLAAAFALPAAAGAQGPAPAGGGTPEAFAKAYTQRFHAGDLDGAAAMMHPDALATMRRFLNAMVALDSSEASLSQVLGVRTAAEARGLSDAQSFARFMTFYLQQQPGLAEAMRTATVESIGSVPEGDRDRHVIYRLGVTSEGITISKLYVISLRRLGDGWGAMLSGDMEGMIAAMGARVGTP